MSRHSKWSKVKQFKGAIDAKRSASFTKLAREITVAAKEKGGDPNMNAGLRAAVERARASSMPKEAIERAIARGTGEGKEGVIETLMYEAYAPGGAALVIECLTDNRNRTAGEVKHILSKSGGSLAASGAVTYLFDHVGVLRIPVGAGLVPALPDGRPQGSPLPEDAELSFIDAGATSIVEEDGALEIHSASNDLSKVADAAAKLGFVADTVEFQWIPKTLVETDEETGTKVAGLIETLEEDDDVSRVFSNLA